MKDQTIFQLSEAEDISNVGGKAYALGRLIRAGFQVPDGFVLSSNAPDNIGSELSRFLLSRFDELGARFVAVRSSAINEDSNDAAWAGQLETYLNCRKEELIQRVVECRNSINAERAQSYARQKGIEATKVAVLVQAMVDSEISGVAFSAHPVSGDINTLVIEAGFGLGEAIVSGQVTPDTYVLHKADGQIIEKHVANQEKMLARNNVGITVWQDVGMNKGKQKLSDEQVVGVLEVTKKIEVFYGYPVDVEWAIYKDKLYILQSRPITTIAS